MIVVTINIHSQYVDDNEHINLDTLKDVIAELIMDSDFELDVESVEVKEVEQS